MGHEFMELKNKSAAIQSYRHAIGNLRDIHDNFVQFLTYWNLIKFLL